MRRRLDVVAVSGLFLAQAIAGCAGMTEQQKGTAIGSTVGAVVGGAAGAAVGGKNPAKGAAVGAAVGAVVGGAAGWGVGEYRVRQVQGRDQAAAASRYTPDQGIVTSIDRVSAAPHELKPGDQLTIQTHYTVLAPPENREVKVREVRSIFFNNQRLTELPEKELTLRQGTNEVQEMIPIPRSAAEGSYVVVTTAEAVAPGGWRQVRGQADFAVTTAAGTKAVASSAVATPTAGSTSATASTMAPASPARPPMTDVAIPPTARPPDAVPAILYVKILQANLREGAGAGFKILAQIARGVRLDVLETRGPDKDRWFKVRLPNGQEGWVAGSAVGATP